MTRFQRQQRGRLKSCLAAAPRMIGLAPGPFVATSPLMLGMHVLRECQRTFWRQQVGNAWLYTVEVQCPRRWWLVDA